jgi:hypothetical protein
MTLIGACRDTLRVLRAEPGTQPEELKSVLDEIEIPSGKLDEVWHDGWRARFVRTINLAGSPLHGLLDCFVVNVFR